MPSLPVPPIRRPTSAVVNPVTRAAAINRVIAPTDSPFAASAPAPTDARAGAVARAIGGGAAFSPPPTGTNPWGVEPQKPASLVAEPSKNLNLPTAPKPETPTPTPAPGPQAPLETGKAAFDLRRQDIDARLEEDLQARAKAVERQLAGRGLDDSGILDARQRTAEVDTRRAAAGERNQVAMEESQQAFGAQQAALERALQEKLGMASIDVAKRGQDISKETFYAGLQQAGELAKAGLSIQESTLKLTEKGMSQQDAQYYAGLAQAAKLAEKGFSYQDAALELQRQGMTQQNSQFFAGLAQAKELAVAGLSIQEAQLKLTERGMTQEDARYYAGLAQAKDLAEKGLSLQETQIKLQEKGMEAENARFFAGLAQAGELARAGLGLQEQQIRLQEKGMTQEDARFYAGLAQAKDLAQKGLDQAAIEIELKKKGMDQQNAQFYAGQAFEKEMYNLENVNSVKRAYVADKISQIDPKDPNYKQKIDELLLTFSTPAPASAPALPEGASQGSTTTPPKGSSHPAAGYENFAPDPSNPSASYPVLFDSRGTPYYLDFFKNPIYLNATEAARLEPRQG